MSLLQYYVWNTSIVKESHPGFCLVTIWQYSTINCCFSSLLLFYAIHAPLSWNYLLDCSTTFFQLSVRIQLRAFVADVTVTSSMCQSVLIVLLSNLCEIVLHNKTTELNSYSYCVLLCRCFSKTPFMTGQTGTVILRYLFMVLWGCYVISNISIENRTKKSKRKRTIRRKSTPFVFLKALWLHFPERFGSVTSFKSSQRRHQIRHKM